MRAHLLHLSLQEVACLLTVPANANGFFSVMIEKLGAHFLSPLCRRGSQPSSVSVETIHEKLRVNWVLYLWQLSLSFYSKRAALVGLN